MPRSLMFTVEFIFDEFRFSAGIVEFAPGMFAAHLVIGPIGVSMAVRFAPNQEQRG